jgi:hypothetical protein
MPYSNGNDQPHRQEQVWSKSTMLLADMKPSCLGKSARMREEAEIGELLLKCRK